MVFKRHGRTNPKPWRAKVAYVDAGMFIACDDLSSGFCGEAAGVSHAHAGHTVVFDDDGSYILNKSTGDINWLREDNSNYMLDKSLRRLLAGSLDQREAGS